MSDNKSLATKAQTAIKAAQKPGTMSGFNSGAIESVLIPYADAIRKALPGGQSPNAIIQAAVFQISNTPALKECSIPSLIGAVLNTSLLGLNPTLGHCFYVPRNVRRGDEWAKECIFQIGYQGLIELAFRTGNVRELFAEVVREGDAFDFERGTNPKITHKPQLDNTGKLVSAYAVVEFANGGRQFVVMGRNEIEKRRLASANQKGDASGIWAQWTDEMWKKTALRSLLKITPLSSQVSTAMSTDDKTVNIDDIKQGAIGGAHDAEGDDITEASDLQTIRDGCASCNDTEELERYWQQGASEWSNRADVKTVFNQRKNELA